MWSSFVARSFNNVWFVLLFCDGRLTSRINGFDSKEAAELLARGEVERRNERKYIVRDYVSLEM